MALPADFPPPPAPLPASVKRFDREGRPTIEQLVYERALLAWLTRLRAASMT